MDNFIPHITTLKQQLSDALATASTAAIVEQIRITFLGRSGSITQLMNSLKEMPLDDKKTYGPLFNNLKLYAHEHIELTLQKLAHKHDEQQSIEQQYFDVTAYKQRTFRGRLHIYSIFVQQLEDIFTSMGYAIATANEVENSYYNFEALNISENHPARDMHDTFWLTIPGKLMRTHTSNAQIHALEKKELPLALFSSGRVFRNEATDASHDFMFMQGEVLFVDKQVSLANLLATAQAFLQAIFETKELVIRTRPGYFPFVEPGLEIDASCPFCTQTGCSICKHTGWIELLGAGLIHPHVLRMCGVDPHEYQGFAIGFGLTRLAMIKYGITDIRLFGSNDLEFLQQF